MHTGATLAPARVRLDVDCAYPEGAMSASKQPDPTSEQTKETQEQAADDGDDSAQREQVAALRRAAAFRDATARAFDTRTERWQEAGLSDQIDKAESRRALREAIVLLILLVGVLYIFANRNTLP